GARRWRSWSRSRRGPPPGRCAWRRFCHARPQPHPRASVELRRLGAAALELEEVRVVGQQRGTVEDLAGVLTTRDAGQDRPEERGAVDVEDRGPDLVAHRVHATVVRGAQLVVVLIGPRGGREAGVQTGRLERLGDDGGVLDAAPLVVDPGPQLGVERAEDLLAV